MSAGAAVSAVGVSKVYTKQSGERLEVLRDVSLSVERDHFVCLLGPSGSGKSTFLHMVAGLVHPDTGVLTLGPGGMPRIGYVFQRPRILNWRTVEQNLALAMKAAGIPREEQGARIAHYLRVTRLEGFGGEYPQALSIGMQQRVAVARAFIIDPDILLMDEPFGALDELTAQEMRAELLRLWREARRTVLFVTHNVMEAIYLADEIHVFSPRPARIVRSFVVDIPRERSIFDDGVVALQREIFRCLGLP